MKFQRCSKPDCRRTESPQFGTGECTVHAWESLGDQAARTFRTNIAYTVRCLHCGYVPIPAGRYTANVETVLQAFASGGYCILGVSCPSCHREVDLEHISRGRIVCGWCADLKDPKNQEGVSHGLCHECEMKMQQEGRAL